MPRSEGSKVEEILSTALAHLGRRRWAVQEMRGIPGAVSGPALPNTEAAGKSPTVTCRLRRMTVKSELGVYSSGSQ